MIRPAKFVDTPRLVQMLVELQPRTRFAHVPVDEAYAKAVIGPLIGRNGNTTVGGTLVQVWEEESRVRGFIAGFLDRVYGIGRRLWASDQFLVVEPDADPRAMPALLAAYVTWADGNPLVEETRLSWSDATPDGARMGAIFERMGFQECGRAYRREVVR